MVICMKEQYFDIFTDNYPLFIDKYLNLDEFKRIDHIGLDCGADYVKYMNIKFWYSRLDHSKTVALMTWHFTHDKKQTLAALFHDLGTPCFSHCIDYLLGDSINQESSEKNIYDVIEDSDKIKLYLQFDGVDINDLKDISSYKIIDSDRPKLCTDRLDGILSTCYIWIQTMGLDEIKEIYDDMVVLSNEDNEVEIGFKTKEICEKFFKGVYDYSMALQKNEDKFMMQFIADSLKKLISENKLSLDELYKLKELDIVKKLEKYESWKIFTKLDGIDRSTIEPNNYYVSVESKKRYAIPLCDGKRITEISEYSKELLDDYKQFKDTKYVYSKKIKQI